MLSKKKRISQKEIEEVFKVGKFLNSPTLAFRFIANKSSSSAKISFIAPKSIAKLAVKRNYLRRRGYLALRSYLDRVPPGVVGVFIFKKYEDDIKILEKEIENIFNKIN